MISVDRSALLCDLAEAYGIYDMRSLPVSTVATFAAGLRDDSRIKMLMRGDKYPQDTMLLAALIDEVGGLLWRFGVYEKKPKSVVASMMEGDRPKNVKGYATPEAFMAARSKYMRNENNVN